MRLRGRCATLLVTSSLALSSGFAQNSQPAPHIGPRVAEGAGGPKRFVPALLEAFDLETALRDLAYADGWYRSAGSDGYRATLERVERRLRAAGFGSDERLELYWLEEELPRPVWQPRSASLTLRVEGQARVLHAFAAPGDRDRVMLPEGAPSADVLGRPVFGLEHVQPGTVLVTTARLSSSLLKRAKARGAQAVLSSALFAFTIDPSGGRRHQDAILYTSVDPEWDLVPVAQISPRTQRAIEQAAAVSFGTTVALTAEVEEGPRRVRTLVAEVIGETIPGEAVVVPSHAQEPGAGDNASGVAGMCAAACALARELGEGNLAWPRRTLVFVWGDEIVQSTRWLEHTDRRAVAAISADMLGQSAETGAIALLERGPDPGAVAPIAPDEHTPWGAGEVAASELEPNGLALVVRTALADVAERAGGWRTSENPWEGGSDHDVFLERGTPAVLLWHFTDFTYHTSLDRLEMIDGEELRRSCVAVIAAALAVASPEAGDLERYLASNELERGLRVAAARDADLPDVAELWNEWCDGAAEWLRALCSAASEARGH